MSAFTTKVAAVICTILLSTTCITAAVGPAEAGTPNSVVSVVRVA